MRTKKLLMIGIIGLLVGGSALYLALSRPESAQEIPTLSPRSAASQNSAEFASLLQKVENYRSEIRQRPEVIRNYVELAWIFLQEGRVSGNQDEYHPKAQWLIDEVLRREPENFEATITKASMLLTLHQFAAARDLALKAISGNSYNAFAYGVLTDAYGELGEYEKAVEACDKMSSIRPDLRSYSRASYLRELHGDMAGAIEAMRMAVSAGAAIPENVNWCRVHLGHLYFQQGDLASAEQHYQAALAAMPDYSPALAGIGQVAAARGNYPEAISAYQKAIEAQSIGEHLLALAEVYEAAGMPEQARKEYDAALALLNEELKKGMDVADEVAHALNRCGKEPERALRLAREVQRRRPTVNIADILAWALYNAGKYAEAREAITHALRLETKYARFYYHAGMIEHRLGNTEASRKYLKQALAINPYFSVLDAGIARQTLEKIETAATNVPASEVNAL